MADNKTIQKIFSLTDYRRLQLTSKIPERGRESFREYGYFGGGLPSGSTVDRIDYSNDTATASVRGPLVATTYGAGSTGNSNFGYIASGGSQGTNIQTRVQRINYSNDTSTSHRTNLSIGRGRVFGATSNNNFGYFGGGRISAVGTTIVDRLDYSNDLLTAIRRANFINSKSQGNAAGNSNFGWYRSGQVTDRIDYSNDLSSPLVRANSSLGTLSQATGNSNFGYFANGFAGGVGSRSSVDRLNYSNDLVAFGPRFNFNSTYSSISAAGNSNFGYFNTNEKSSILYSIVNRCDYSNDTVTASVRGPLSSSRSFTSATSSHSFGGTPNSSFASNFTFPTVPNAGYFGGGTDGTNNLASIDKVDYANDTATASVRSALSVAKSSLGATGNSNFGYFAGGVSPGGSTTVERIEYSSDTQNTSIRTNLQTILTQSASVGNSNFGYFSGSNSNIQRIDYSNDNTSIVGNIDDSRQLNTATSTRNFGYFSGGDIPEVSIIQRMNFSNDTANALFRTNHAFNRRQHGGVGNETYGYYGGGVISGGFSTIVERLDYTNDTTQPIIRGPLSLPRRGYLGSTGSQNFGYFAGGDVPGPTYFSTVDRINYSNDTAIASVRGSLPVAKGTGAATSPLAYGGAPIYFTNPLPQVFQDQIEFDDSNTLDLPFKRVLGSYGYFGGDFLGKSTIERIDYSNDLITASARSNLAPNHSSEMGSCGNNNFGYFCGGDIDASLVRRIDYSNDTQNTNSRGNLSSSRRRVGGFGNNSFGYMIGGDSPTTRMDRIDYSNDNATASIRATLKNDTRNATATGNYTFGYYNNQATSNSTIERINYSNDLSSSSSRNILNKLTTSKGATGNSNFGYFGGGGGVPGPVVFSSVDRIDYSNDTTTASIRGNLAYSGGVDATGNNNFGYFAGDGSNRTWINRIDYSNDTAQASTRGPLNLTRIQMSTTTNARNS